MSRVRCAAVALALIAAACGRTVVVREPAVAPDALFARLAPSVVYTRATYEAEGATTVDSGAGVLVDRTGLILTTCHQLTNSEDGTRSRTVEVLLAEPDRARRTFRPQTPVTADVLACSDAPDLGLIRLRGGAGERAFVPLAAALPAPGESLVVVGPTHLGFLWSVQACLVSGVGDQRETGTAPFGSASADDARGVRNGMTGGNVIQVGCHVNPMSGSPAVNAAGAIVGLHLFSRFNTDEPPEEVNYYIGIDQIRAFVGPYLTPPLP